MLKIPTTSIHSPGESIIWKLIRAGLAEPAGALVAPGSSPVSRGLVRFVLFRLARQPSSRRRSRLLADINKGVGGELWSVHGGGFYHAQKYTAAPEKSFQIHVALVQMGGIYNLVVRYVPACTGVLVWCAGFISLIPR